MKIEKIEAENSNFNWLTEMKKREIIWLYGGTDFSKEDICKILHINDDSLYPKNFKTRFGFDLPPREKLARNLKRFGYTREIDLISQDTSPADLSAFLTQ